jgi:hypothetical protein
VSTRDLACVCSYITSELLSQTATLVAEDISTENLDARKDGLYRVHKEAQVENSEPAITD